AAFALLQRLEELLAAIALRLLEEGAAREHHVVAVAVELDDLGLELGSHERMQVSNPPEVDERGGQEPAEPDVQDETTLDDLDHRAFDRAARLHDLLDPAPGALVLRARLRKDQAAFLVLLLEHEGLELVANLHALPWVDVVADRQFLGGDDACGLVTDVQQDLVAVDLHDRPLEDVALLEVPQRGLDGLTELVGGVVPHLARRLDLNQLLPRTKRAPPTLGIRRGAGAPRGSG